MKDGKLERKNAWKNSLFLAGFLNQNIPFLQNSTLGKYFLSQATQFDYLRDWPADPSVTSELVSYNRELVPLLIEEAERVISQHESKLFLTLSPGFLNQI